MERQAYWIKRLRLTRRGPFIADQIKHTTDIRIWANAAVATIIEHPKLGHPSRPGLVSSWDFLQNLDATVKSRCLTDENIFRVAALSPPSASHWEQTESTSIRISIDLCDFELFRRPASSLCSRGRIAQSAAIRPIYHVDLAMSAACNRSP